MLQYFHPEDIYGLKANALQAVRMCEAFRQMGLEVRLIFPRHLSDGVVDSPASLWEGIGVDAPFPLLPYAAPFARQAHAIGFPVLPAWKAVGLARVRSSLQLDRMTWAYSRCAFSASVLAAWRRLRGGRYRIAFEFHERIEPPLRARVLHRADLVVAISHAARKLVVERYGVPESRVITAPDGVNLALFKRAGAGVRTEAPRAEPSARGPAPVRVVYAGKLHTGFVRFLVDLSRRLDSSVQFTVLGRATAESEAYRAAAGEDRMRFLGLVSPATVPRFLQEADILLMWYPPDLRYVETISPLKLFEYLAAGRPIVAPAFPAIAEILTDEVNALLVGPHDTSAFAAAIRRLVREPALADRLARRAAAEAPRYTWARRAERILDALQGIPA